MMGDNMLDSVIREHYAASYEAWETYVPWGQQSSRRASTLLQIMKTFHAVHLVDTITNLQLSLYACERLRDTTGGGGQVPEDKFREIAQLLKRAQRVCMSVGFTSSVVKIAASNMSLGNMDCSSLANELRNVYETLLVEAVNYQFARIAPDRIAYLVADNDLTDDSQPFGPAVAISFPSAKEDIKDASNCLAMELNTACVYHLMCAAEVGLRTLAWDRRIKLPKKLPLALSEWEKIIEAIEKEEQAIQGYPKTLARESQFEFYHGTMMEYRRFKNCWRNRLMHAREHCDRDQAHSAFEHVRAFMQILASRISETKRTPIKWVTREGS